MVSVKSSALQRIVLHERSLTPLRQGLENEKADVARHVGVIREKFASENAGSYQSAQSRVAAIAVLAEIIRREGAQDDTTALMFAQKILSDAQTVTPGTGIFLFPHEEKLLKTVTEKPAKP
ncbi:hypothetical protein VP01_3618g1 [Puccinia sorghi]|uniref:Uncharacterized protein n=1 Tax=Puccinia sorghi TaxID=27349 RepID=A0A0L6UWU2_9BASI|nr:hypothetical protein VP01_3618g1 [Puccinia sorghi]